MPRTITSGMLAAIKAANLSPAWFVLITFASGPVYLWTGYGDVTWNGHTWTGAGDILGISTIEEGSDVQARGVTLTLCGISSALLADALGDFQVGLPVTIYLGAFSGSSLISDPITAWSGRTDQPTVEVGGETATIAVQCESRLMEMNVPVNRRWTNDDQQREHPGDLGFQFVSSIQEVAINWGHKTTGSNA
jgi:hypothetical protein